MQVRLLAGHQIPKSPNGFNLPSRVVPVILTICEEFGVTYAELAGRSHARRIASARHEAMRRLRRLPWGSTVPSTSQIAAWFNRDHTSVCYAINGDRRKNVSKRYPPLDPWRGGVDAGA